MYRTETETKFKALEAVIRDFCDANDMSVISQTFEIFIRDNVYDEDIDIRDLMEFTE